MATLISYAFIGWFFLIVGILIGIIAEKKDYRLLEDVASFLALLGFFVMVWCIGAVIVSKIF